MNQAQDLHEQGSFETAQEHWQQAVNCAPDAIEKARAIRGDAASAYQRGNEPYAREKAEAAFSIHDQVVEASTQFGGPNRLRGLRERAQSAGVLGRFVTASVARRELSGELLTDDARTEANPGLTMLDSALRDIEMVEAETAATDQYRINSLSHLAVGHSLYGDDYTAAYATEQARKIAWKSENEPGVSFGRRARAVVRAVVRAYSATAVHALATAEPSTRRTIALKIATHKRLGL